jgi:hypothetical protein
VFKKLELEWEIEHPDLVKELQKQLDEKDALIKVKNNLIVSLRQANENLVTRLRREETEFPSLINFPSFSTSEEYEYKKTLAKLKKEIQW